MLNFPIQKNFIHKTKQLRQKIKLLNITKILCSLKKNHFKILKFVKWIKIKFFTAALLKTGGTNRLIACGDKCITPTDQLFWKKDVGSGVRTRSQEKEQKKVTQRQFEKYFKQKDIQRWLDSLKDGSINSDLELVILEDNWRYILTRTLIIGLIILSIVNNQNILTDSRRYRRRPKIEM